MKNNILKNPRFYISVLLVLFFFFFAVQVPYSHDDWQWGSQIKWDLMLRGFENYNGRYLGNLFEILITRNILAKNIIMALGMLAVIWVVYKFINTESKSKDKTALFVLVAILCLAIPREIFRQTYSWIAAFINFIPPVILIVLYLIIVSNTFDDKNLSLSSIKYPVWATLLIIPLGISTQLFSEHTTVYTVALAAFIVFYTYFKYRKFSALQVVYLVSTIIGALIMFSNRAYSHAASNTDGYKQIASSSTSVFDIYINQMSDTLFLNNYLLNTLLSILCIAIILKSFKNIRSTFHAIVGNMQIFILSTYMIYSLCNKMYPAWNIFTNPQKTAAFNALYSLIFFVCVLSVILLYINGSGLKMKIFMIYGSSWAVAMPLIVANPIGPRCFFASYIFMVIATIEILIYVLNNSSFEFNQLTFAMSSILIMICAFYASIFIDVGIADRTRIETINNAVSNGDNTITLYRLPYEDYYWTTVPPDTHWESFFKEFYNIPIDIELEFINR